MDGPRNASLLRSLLCGVNNYERDYWNNDDKGDDEENYGHIYLLRHSQLFVEIIAIHLWRSFGTFSIHKLTIRAEWKSES